MEVLGVNPGIMCWQVPFPLHKVLLLLPTAKRPLFENLLNFPFGFSVEYFWWRF